MQVSAYPGMQYGRGATTYPDVGMSDVVSGGGGGKRLGWSHNK
jgi:hypothetical protein